MVDRPSLDRNRTAGTNTTSATNETVMVENFPSDHAVRHPKRREGEGEKESHGSRLSRRFSRQSLLWSEVIRRGSLGMSGLLSSLTLTDFGGDSFYNDQNVSQVNICRWDEEDEGEKCHEDEEGKVCNCGSPCDHKPVQPNRRDSMSTGKISTSLRFNDLSYGNEPIPTNCQITEKEGHPIIKETRGSFQDRHPVKPGRRASAITVDQKLLASLDAPPVDGSTKRKSC